MTTPKTQLEVAAQWPKEASLVLSSIRYFDKDLRENLKRVADECMAVAYRAPTDGANA